MLCSLALEGIETCTLTLTTYEDMRHCTGYRLWLWLDCSIPWTSLRMELAAIYKDTNRRRDGLASSRGGDAKGDHMPEQADGHVPISRLISAATT